MVGQRGNLTKVLPDMLRKQAYLHEEICVADVLRCFGQRKWTWESLVRGLKGKHYFLEQVG